MSIDKPTILRPLPTSILPDAAVAPSAVMPSSQLKRLKASLRAEGIVGPQKSKKQKKNALTNGANKEQKAKRNVALQNIREAFNPFEVQAPSRGKDKFEVTNNRTVGGRVTKGVKGRPGVTKGLGEETVRSARCEDAF